MPKKEPLSLAMLERIFEAAKDREINFVSSSDPVTLSNVTQRLFKDFANAAKNELGTNGMLSVEVEILDDKQYDDAKYATVDKNECNAVIVCAAALYARRTFLPD
ncbi:MAG: hypothetical protein DI626_03800 [Micavibrio aeruginosavorus]|uniref:Uncharacterized protein n=1 Tax=Micavibrio aeruginosavorus TaxID=349221 RepID=A0A2W5C0M0_9BACT|nr:MAG: hypothetical protein DI626_03800 [Micavibrio aeruginosavorus]